MHCNEPACAAACLTQAMHKTSEGPVIWREDKCMGCRYCMVSCPFDVPKFEYNSANPEVTKCTMCAERQQNGQIPACVENCPAEALVFGTRRELLAEARTRIAENPELYYDHIYGETEAGGTSFLYRGSKIFIPRINQRLSLQWAGCFCALANDFAWHSGRHKKQSEKSRPHGQKVNFQSADFINY